MKEDKRNEINELKKTFEHIRYGNDQDINQENANSDGFSVPGYKGIFTNKMLEQVAESMLDDDVLAKFKEGEIHIHDFNSYALGTLTCLQIPLDKALKLFEVNNITDAIAVASLVINVNQTQMHGGQAYANFDFDLAPYVEKTYMKYYSDFMEMNLNTLGLAGIDIDVMSDNGELTLKQKIQNTSHEVALRKTKEDTFNAMHRFIVDLNELKIRDGQGAFVSINFGLDTSLYGQIVSESILRAQMKGVNNGLTPNFPILIFKVSKEHNFYPDTKNYFLYELSLKCLSKRLFPNFQFIDSEFNKNPHSDDLRDTVATMGCVDGDEMIEVKFAKDNQIKIFKFKELYNFLSVDEYEWDKNKDTKFKKVEDIFVRDIDGDFTKVKGVIKNKDAGNWYRLTLSDGTDILATADHPLITISGSGNKRTYVEDILKGDMIPTSDNRAISVSEKSFIGFLNLDSYDLTTESDTFVFSGICSHNCRTRVFEDVNGQYGSVSRGNLSFSTLNLPMIAKEANGDIDKFFTLLDEDLDLLTKQLLQRMKYQGTFKVSEFPFLFGNGFYVDSEYLNADDTIEEVIKRGSLSIGFIGLAETLMLLIGKHHGEDAKAQELGYKIISHMREYTDKVKKETQLNFSLLATPSESYSGKSMKSFIKKYGKLSDSFPEIDGNKFFTNSFHVPVWHEISAKKKIEIEAPYHALTNAGHISYIELDGDASSNLSSLDAIVRKMSECEMGYGSINLPLDKCLNCDFNGVIYEDQCPVCGSENIYRVRRITGYLVGDNTKWNSAKQDELKKRTKHN